MATGLSLSLVLLRTASPSPYVSVPPPGTQPEADQFEAWHNAPQGSTEKKRSMAVQAGLYKALYNIIDEYDKPYNDALNRAIGKALALVIADPTIGEGDSQFRKDIQSLINVLKPMLTEAVDAVKEADASRL